jgi:hypothetical protein
VIQARQTSLFCGATSNIRLDNDVSKGSFAYGRVRTAFAGGHEALTLAVLAKAQRLQARGMSRNGYHDPDRYYPHEDFTSILGTIIGVTEDVGSLDVN